MPNPLRFVSLLLSPASACLLPLLPHRATAEKRFSYNSLPLNWKLAWFGEEAGKCESRTQARPGDMSNSLPCASGRLGRKQASVRGGRKTGLATYLIRFAAGPLWGHCGRKQGSVRAGSGPGLATYLIRFAAGPLREEAGKCERRKKDRPGGKLGRFPRRCGSAFVGGLCQGACASASQGAAFAARSSPRARPHLLDQQTR